MEVEVKLVEVEARLAAAMMDQEMALLMKTRVRY